VARVHEQTEFWHTASVAFGLARCNWRSPKL
jgi:hypothetical protein